jgi:hypothetical protein
MPAPSGRADRITSPIAAGIIFVQSKYLAARVRPASPRRLVTQLKKTSSIVIQVQQNLFAGIDLHERPFMEPAMRAVGVARSIGYIPWA